MTASWPTQNRIAPTVRTALCYLLKCNADGGATEHVRTSILPHLQRELAGFGVAGRLDRHRDRRAVGGVCPFLLTEEPRRAGAGRGQRRLADCGGNERGAARNIIPDGRGAADRESSVTSAF